MATLLRNFRLEGPGAEIDVQGQRWFTDGRDRATVPWGHLFGSHRLFGNCCIEPKRILYVVRDPRDTLDSLWRFVAESTGESFISWCKPSRITAWVVHVASYLAGEVMMVRYEDLVGDRHDEMLEQIWTRFDLRKRNGFGWERIGPKVGWSPGPGRSGYWRDWPEDLRERFAACVPPRFLGYDMREV